MAENVREPKQQRSIDKKNRIIEAGYKLFAEKGYFETNTVEIAKVAKVSTGIVYGYFHDKRDILVEVLDIYVNKAFKPVLETIDNLEKPLDFTKVLTFIIDEVVEIHSENAAIHETLHSLSPTDKLVSDKFMALEEVITKNIAAKLTELGYDKPNIAERVHLALETVQSYSHEKVFDKHPYVDYNKMRSLIISMLVSLFE